MKKNFIWCIRLLYSDEGILIIFWCCWVYIIYLLWRTMRLVLRVELIRCWVFGFFCEFDFGLCSLSLFFILGRWSFGFFVNIGFFFKLFWYEVIFFLVERFWVNMFWLMLLFVDVVCWCCLLIVRFYLF